MKRIYSSILLLLVISNSVRAQQQAEKKHYPAGTTVGEATLLEQWTESDGKESSAVYLVDIASPGNYFVKITGNMQKGARQWVTDNGRLTSLAFTAQQSGWQQSTGEIFGAAQSTIKLTTGKHIIRFTAPGNMPPLNDDISFSRSNTHTKLDSEWQRFSTSLNTLLSEKPVSNLPADKSIAAEMNKVLSNPEGNYEHAIDTAFTYSTCTQLYLTAGATYTFNTYSSTKDPVLHLFNAANISAYSWYNDDGGGGYESSITVTIPVTGNYMLLARPYFAGQSGITNIKQNGVNLLTNTPIAGLRFSTTPRTGDLNYSTCRLTSGTTPDTRIFTLISAGGAVNGYNDDYTNTSGGVWDWGLGSRIKKNFTSNCSIVFVCAYSSSRTGVCDVYMGNTNGQLHISEPSNFPLLKDEDAIQSAPNTGVYNCISWSGGITNSWSWPPDAISSWNVPNNDLASFDNFYGNNPARYPGAWGYTRFFATSANASVDLWKAGTVFKHASVTKPGNAHPHGYDWESKPGGLDRQFHPRNALENPNWYGAVSNYYKATGFVANKLANRAFATDAEAVAAGVAVYENAKLSDKAMDKLNGLLIKTSNDASDRFSRLYDNWKRTWAANASLSDPYAYCNNDQYEALQAWCLKNPASAMPLVFKKFTDGDHLTSKLLWVTTRGRYAPLLDEAKKDILDHPYDAEGRFKIHGDHDNGVRYIEKILMQPDTKQVEITPPVTFEVTASPNPVRDILTITMTVKETSRINVSATSGQTGNNRLLQPDKLVTPGSYQYRLNINGFAGAAGDIIVVQVKVNETVQQVKVLVSK